jgi:hypothetical protein
LVLFFVFIRVGIFIVYCFLLLAPYSGYVLVGPRRQTRERAGGDGLLLCMRMHMHRSARTQAPTVRVLSARHFVLSVSFRSAISSFRSRSAPPFHPFGLVPPRHFILSVSFRSAISSYRSRPAPPFLSIGLAPNGPAHGDGCAIPLFSSIQIKVQNSR